MLPSELGKSDISKFFSSIFSADTLSKYIPWKSLNKSFDLLLIIYYIHHLLTCPYIGEDIDVDNQLNKSSSYSTSRFLVRKFEVFINFEFSLYIK